MTVVVDVRGLPKVLAALDALDDRQRQNLERRAVRAAANVFKPALAAAARERHGTAESVPASFAKVKVKVSTRGGGSGREVMASVRPTSPLFNIFEEGARGHEIAPKKAGRIRRSAISGRHVVESGSSPLLAGPAGSSGWTGAGRKRGAAFFAHGPVQHPGFRARPLLPAVFAAEVGKAEETVASIIFGSAGSGLGE